MLAVSRSFSLLERASIGSWVIPSRDSIGDRQATQVVRRLSASLAFPASESSRIRPMSSGANRVSTDHVSQPTGTSRIRACSPARTVRVQIM